MTRNIKLVVGLFMLLITSALALPHFLPRAQACCDGGGNHTSSCAYRNVDPCGVYSGGACFNNYKPDDCTPTTYTSAKVTDLGKNFYFCFADSNPGDSCDDSNAQDCASVTSYSGPNCTGTATPRANLTSCTALGTNCPNSP